MSSQDATAAAAAVQNEPELTQLKLVLKAESIIQRDAIIAALKARNIEPHSAPRDISRKIADNTVDFSFEGFSAVFDGFAIHVDEKDFAEAQKIADTIVKTAQKTKDDPALAQGSSMRKFYFCCLFSLSMPVLFHGLAVYHLFNGVKNGEKFHKVYGPVSIFMFLATGAFMFYVVGQTDFATFMEKLADTL